MRIPLSTYRLQFNSAFTFKDAEKIVLYLKELGISDVYASPVFKCKKGSSHGYDVTDPNAFNAEAGAAGDFDSLTAAASAAGLGWLQDIVPNHMAFSGQNEYLWDVLENGPVSVYGGFFDINWDYPYESMKGRLLAPFLGSPYGEALENGEIKVLFGERGFYAGYYDNYFPLKMESYADILSAGFEELKSAAGGDGHGVEKISAVIKSLKTPQYLSPAARGEHFAFIKKTLWDIYGLYPEIKKMVDSVLAAVNGDKENPESFQQLDRLLSSQHYRLCYWKSGSDEINYRRFFNVNELISLKQENENVFLDTHRLVLELVNAKKITGLRIDHIDGLFNPNGYIGMLRKSAPDAYIAVEKILGFGENLPHFWPVQGSTGYDFMNYANGLFCARENSGKFGRIYLKFSGAENDYRELMLSKKRMIIGRRMAGDVENLARTLKEVSGSDRHGSDMTMYALKRALVELLALFPVYRTYVEPAIFTEQDRNYITYTLDAAASSMPGLAKEIEFIGKFLLLKFPKYITDEQERLKWVNFVMRFQQLTGPLMAKGFEDTFLYVYNRLISLNEVGGFPERFGVDTAEFHEYCAKKAAVWPASMNATSTHDAKRGEDTRARINVLSEIPDEWEARLKKWEKINSKISTGVDSNDEYFFYQTILGSWPDGAENSGDYAERIKNYMIKAVREAKVHTAWVKPDLNYENRFMEFISKALDNKTGGAFLEDFTPFRRKISFYGMFNSLSQLLIKGAAPGIPDFYQGSEFWDLSLVDPDNRGPVDYAARQRSLEEIAKRDADPQNLIQELFSSWQDGRIKMFAMRALLKGRALNTEIFEKGNYEPALLDGSQAKNVIAFIRRSGFNMAIAAAPRLLTGLIKENEMPLGEKTWKDTLILLPPRQEYFFRDAYTGAEFNVSDEIRVGKIFSSFPGALLIGKRQNAAA